MLRSYSRSLQGARRYLALGLVLGMDGNFDNAAPPFAEQLVRFSDLVEGERMRQQRPQIQSTVPYQFHQPAHSLLASRAKRRDDLVIAEARGEGLEGYRQFSGIDAQARQRATGAENAQGALKCPLRAERFDRHIDSYAVC